MQVNNVGLEPPHTLHVVPGKKSRVIDALPAPRIEIHWQDIELRPHDPHQCLESAARTMHIGIITALRLHEHLGFDARFPKTTVQPISRARRASPNIIGIKQQRFHGLTPLPPPNLRQLTK
jgi:hypothetical protein